MGHKFRSKFIFPQFYFQMTTYRIIFHRFQLPVYVIYAYVGKEKGAECSQRTSEGKAKCPRETTWGPSWHSCWRSAKWKKQWRLRSLQLTQSQHSYLPALPLLLRPSLLPWSSLLTTPKLSKHSRLACFSVYNLIIIANYPMCLNSYTLALLETINFLFRFKNKK